MKRYLIVTEGGCYQSDRLNSDDVEAFDNGAIVAIIDTHGPTKYNGMGWERVVDWCHE